MRKLKVGDIYYWGNDDPEMEPPKLCIITESNPHWDAGVFWLGHYNCELNDHGRSILKVCIQEEIKAGRLHYIGRL